MTSTVPFGNSHLPLDGTVTFWLSGSPSQRSFLAPSDQTTAFGAKGMRLSRGGAPGSLMFAQPVSDRSCGTSSALASSVKTSWRNWMHFSSIT